MQRFEILYRFAKHYKCSFTYDERIKSKNCTLVKNDLIFSYTDLKDFKYIMMNGKEYNNFLLALTDYESLILLHQ